MDCPQDDDAGSSTVSITVLSVTPMRAGKLFALASVEINVDGVLIEIHGVRATRTATGATRVELPTFRDATGQPRTAIVLPAEIYRPIGDAVLEVLIERGIAKRRFNAASLEPTLVRSS
jgi:stage V sporulation protein G